MAGGKDIDKLICKSQIIHLYCIKIQIYNPNQSEGSKLYTRDSSIWIQVFNNNILFKFIKKNIH